jgi:ABC-type antimicrobial peptide transport system permease subunit
LTLGLLGSAVGVALGLQAARSINYMVELLWGYRPVWTLPIDWITLGIALTVAVCIVAGLIPARRAARANIISALQTT